MAMGRLYEPVEVGQVSKQRINIDVIGYVVTEVRHGGLENRRQPNGVDAQLDQIWQSVNNSRKVSYAVLIAVLKGAGIDLIDDPGLPPIRASPRHSRPASIL
jgi:hypothetical protein